MILILILILIITHTHTHTYYLVVFLSDKEVVDCFVDRFVIVVLY